MIGNSAYQHGSPLRNPANDAANIAAALRSCRFTLVGGRAGTELGNEALHARLADFRQASAPASVALFFFSGHGLEVDGPNYLLPVDAILEEKFQVKHRALALEEVLESMAAGPDKLKIVILDCCRDNPLARNWSRSGGGGLAAPASTPGGTVLVFATAPGKVALDGDARNRPSSAVLKAALPAPGRELEQIIKEQAATVKRNTGGAQEPWMTVASPLCRALRRRTARRSWRRCSRSRTRRSSA